MARVQIKWLLRSVLALIGSLSLLLADEQRVPKKAVPAPASKQAEKNKPASATVIAYLETRDRVITIHAGSKYTVKTQTGKVLAENISVDKLQAGYPDLYKLLDTGIAKDGSFIHAGVLRFVTENHQRGAR
ncbi:MAG: hypothetical protein ACYDH9_27320 [Limisphaerales bacterium]